MVTLPSPAEVVIGFPASYADWRVDAEADSVLNVIGVEFPKPTEKLPPVESARRNEKSDLTSVPPATASLVRSVPTMPATDASGEALIVTEEVVIERTSKMLLFPAVFAPVTMMRSPAAMKPVGSVVRLKVFVPVTVLIEKVVASGSVLKANPVVTAGAPV